MGGRPALRLSGKRVGRLLVIEKVGTTKNGGDWLCLCDCGVKKVLGGTALSMGMVNSCSCIRTENTAALRRTHGMSNTKIYVCWEEIRKRCRNPKVKAYKHYGARGIDVCDEWYNSFSKFYSDMIEGYEEHLTIDRIDVNKGYYKENCRWATWEVQNYNKRNSFLIEYKGQKLNKYEWSKITGIHPHALYSRIKLYGWSVERALTTPQANDYKNENFTNRRTSNRKSKSGN